MSFSQLDRSASAEGLGPQGAARDGVPPEEAQTRPAAIITGASRGIGLALAKEFGRQGHVLLLVSRSLGALKQLAQEIEGETGGEVHVADLDLLDEGAASAISRLITAKGLHAEVLINNAGLSLLRPFHQTPSADALRVLDLNVRAATALTLELLPGMVKRGHGAILNVASLAGLVPVPNMALYGASKSYLIALSRALNAELRGSGVHVSVLAPGPVRTSMLSGIGLDTGERLGWQVFALHPEMVARVAYDGLLARRNLITPGLLGWLAAFGIAIMPRAILTRLAGWAVTSR